MTNEFLENLGLDISLSDTPVDVAEDSHENNTTNTDSVKDDETITPKEDVEKKAEDEVVQQVAPEKDSQQEELERLRKENENLNKRLKDTQRSLTQKSEELKNARKREVEDSVVEDDADDDDDWFNEPSDDEEVNEKSQGDQNLKEIQSKLDVQEEELRLLKEYQEQQRYSQALSAWQKAEAPIKDKYPDYAEIIDGPFLDAINAKDETSAFLMAEFIKEGSTPEAAYKVAKKYCDYIGYKAKSATTETMKKSNNMHKTAIDDPDFNSAPPSRDNAEFADLDPLESFYANR